MANPEHVKIVKQGAEAIKRWRDGHPGQKLDLSNADFKGDNLHGADLSDADLSNAVLELADLSLATLVQADLSMANLKGADLSGANLSGASLRATILYSANLASADLIAASLVWTYLARADLTGADLRFATFNGADLTEANLTQARCDNTVFANCYLHSVDGLKTVQHERPSSIGIDTLERSGGNIPEEFLRGAGVSDTVIDYAHSLVGKPIEFYTCMISYDSRDQPFPKHLYTDLYEKVRVWYYPKTSIMGRDIWEQIDYTIRIYDKLIVVCSKNSLHNENVIREIERALKKEADIAKENQRRREEAKKETKEPILLDKDVLFPIRIDNYVLEEWDHPLKNDVVKKTIGDFRNWENPQAYAREFQKLLHALNPHAWPPSE